MEKHLKTIHTRGIGMTREEINTLFSTRSIQEIIVDWKAREERIRNQNRIRNERAPFYSYSC